MDTDLRRPGDTGRMPTLRQAVTGIELAMLTTVDGDARPRTRPVVVVSGEHDGELWLLTSTTGGAWRLEPRAAVSVAHSTPTRWVSISGTAERVDDPRRLRDLWRDSFANWFPRGPQDPALRLLRIDVAVVETWNLQDGTRTKLEVRDLACPQALEAAGLPDPEEPDDTLEHDELEHELAPPTDAAQGAPWTREQNGRLLLSLEHLSTQLGHRRH